MHERVLPACSVNVNGSRNPDESGLDMISKGVDILLHGESMETCTKIGLVVILVKVILRTWSIFGRTSDGGAKDDPRIRL